MATLSAPSGSPEIQIVGEAHPHAYHPFDWLAIRLVVVHGEHRWEFVEDCVTKQEIHEPCRWLDKIAARDYSMPYFSSISRRSRLRTISRRSLSPSAS